MNAIATHTGNSTFPAMLKAYKAEIARALPRHLDGDRMARIALTCFRQNPALGNCDPKSVFAAVVMAAQLGLEPGIGGQAYLIPYRDECQFVPGWQGLVDLVSRAGRASVWTGAVHEGDEFEYALGDSPHVTHRPTGDDDSKLTHVYAIGRIDGAKWPVIEVWTMAKVRKHRDRFNKVGKRHYSFGNEEMYGRKVALLQVLKYMPKSIELQTAVALQQAADTGHQSISTEDAIDGTWTPVPEAIAAPEVEDKPEYTSEEFAAQIKRWQPVLESGKRSADEIIAMAETKATLTDAQKLIIRDYAAPQGEAS